MHCSSCGALLLEGKRFCHVCGAPAGASCPHCGSLVEADFAFCPDCGRQVGPGQPGAGPGPSARPGPEPPGAAAIRAGEPGPRPDAPEPALSARPSAQPSGPIAGERKQVTVLFCDLAGSTAIAESMDPEDYRDLLDRYLKLAIREIDRMEGFVNQLAGDGFMALFGAPKALEDEPERAVRAALEIHAALERLASESEGSGAPELRARIGIHTGPVVVGTVGSDLKMDYTAIGDTTNLAARLQTHAEPGAILVSDTTRNLIEGRFDLRELAPVEVKGKAAPVQAFEVLGMSEAMSPMAIAEARGLTPLVGFHEELAQLDACFDRIAGGLPQMVSVIGDPGTGKSRLAYEFKQRLARREAVIFEARASALTQSVPFAPFRTMMKEFFELAPGEDTDCACEKIADRLRHWDPDLASIYPAMCALLTVPGDDLSHEGQRQRIIESFQGLVGAVVASSAVVLILEDLHWFDEASREILERHVTIMERWPLMVLVTHRPDYQPSWQVQSAFTQLVLRPFDEAEARQIVRERAGGRLPGPLEQRIVARAEGNPFFLEEITRALVDQGQIVREAGGVRLSGSVESIRIPDTVQELIEARLDRLTPPAKRVAQVAAVLGRQFRVDQLSELLGPEGIAIEPALAELESGGLIHLAVIDRNEFRFGESLTQSVSYEGLLLKERRELHERIAALIESDPRGMTSERAGLVAHHLAQSENRTKAIDSLLAAGRSAAELPSYPSALDLYRKAWKLAEQALADQPEDRARRWVIEATMGLCRVAYVSTELQDTELAARRGAELAEELGDSEAFARMLSLRGMLVVAGDGTRFDEGIELLERALALAREGGFENAVIQARRALGWTYLLDGRFADAREALEALARDLREAGEHDPASDQYLLVGYSLAMAALWRDDLAAATEIAERAYEQALSVPNRTTESGAASVLAQVHFARGAYASAREWAERALATGQEIGNPGAVRTGATVAMGARLELGETLNTARFTDLIDQTLDSSGDLGMTGHLVVELLVALGDVERATRYSDETALRSGGRLRQMQSLLATAHTLRGQGLPQARDAEAEYRLVGDVAREVGSRSFEIAAALGVGQTAALRGDLAAAAATLREAAQSAGEADLVRLRDQALRALAEIDALREPERTGAIN